MPPSGCVIRVSSRVTSRKNARGTAKGVDFEPGVVGDGGNTRRPRRAESRRMRRRSGMPRLQHGVLEKCRARLLGRGYPQFLKAVQFEGQVR